MALFFRRYYRLSRLTQIILALFLLQLMIFLSKELFYKSDYKMGNLTVLDITSADYHFINSNFSSASKGSWQNVGNTIDLENKFLAFSAFLDDRQENRFVNLIAVAKTKTKSRRQKVWCKFWYKHYGNFYMATVSGTYKLLNEHWGLPYSGYYIQCPIKKDVQTPNAVSLLNDPAETPNNIFELIVNFNKPANWSILNVPSLYTNMAVCVKPLHYDYNKVMEFIEFIELHQIMGVNHFFFYNHTVGSQVNCLLNNYIKENIVTVLPWELPLVSQKEIRTEGIFAALNDCLYRTMHLYSHVAFIDFDEFIIPREHSTYRQLFEFRKILLQQPSAYGIGLLSKSITCLTTNLNAKDQSVKPSFIFQNAFFYRQWPDEIEISNFDDPVAANLLILKKTRRKTALHRHRTRSKYIIKPELVNMVGNHFIWEHADKKFKSLNVSPNDAILHHYRICEFGGDDCITQESVVDKTAYRYKDQLTNAVKSRIEKHKAECHLEKFI